jgi:hypothetical protein
LILSPSNITGPVRRVNPPVAPISNNSHYDMPPAGLPGRSKRFFGKSTLFPKNLVHRRRKVAGVDAKMRIADLFVQNPCAIRMSLLLFASNGFFEEKIHSD